MQLKCRSIVRMRHGSYLKFADLPSMAISSRSFRNFAVKQNELNAHELHKGALFCKRKLSDCASPAVKQHQLMEDDNGVSINTNAQFGAHSMCDEKSSKFFYDSLSSRPSCSSAIIEEPFANMFSMPSDLSASVLQSLLKSLQWNHHIKSSSGGKQLKMADINVNEQMELRQALLISVYLQHIIDGGNVQGGLKILEHCVEKGNDYGRGSAYVVKDLVLINNIVFAFAFMKLESYLDCVVLTERILGLLTKWPSKVTANATTIYALVLALARQTEALKHKELSSEGSLDDSNNENIWKAWFTDYLVLQLQYLVKLENIDVSNLLLSIDWRYSDVRNHDNLVAAKIRELFPGVELKTFQRENENEFSTYGCSLLSDFNQGIKLENVSLKFTQEQLEEMAKEQKSLEQRQFVELDSVIMEKKQENKGFSLMEYVMHRWRGALELGFRQFLDGTDQLPDALLIKPFFTVLRPHVYVDLMLNHLKGIIDYGSTTDPKTLLRFNEIALGRAVKKSVEFHMQNQVLDYDKVMKLYNRYLFYLSSEKIGPSEMNHRELWHYCCKELYGERFRLSRDATKRMPIWPHNLYAWVGQPLLELALQCANLFKDINVAKESLELRDFKTLQSLQMIPAFVKSSRHSGEKSGYTILPSFKLKCLLKMEKAFYFKKGFNCIDLPMLSPPVPRVSADFGGFLLTSAEFVRQGDFATQPIIRKLHDWPNHKLLPLLDSLNSLSTIPWKINERVLDVVLDLFQNGAESLANSKHADDMHLFLPKQAAQKCVPESDVNLRSNFVTWRKQTSLPAAKLAEFLAAKRDAVDAAKQRQRLLLRQLLITGKLSVVSWLRHKTFWFISSLDFRGRVYPTSTHFSHIGPDIDRGLLLFAEGRPLGPKQPDCSGQFVFDGLDWLKIHLANLHGAQKRKSLLQRRNFIDDNLSEVLASAEDPINNSWWSVCESPWQALATCFEICNALKCSDTSTYVCHLPVHQDGSCNGFQHYCALNRDLKGAVQVNVVGGTDTPGDLYESVANQVESRRQLDAVRGDPLAKACEGLVDRSIVKQPVMTTVYGVTHMGATDQIMSALRSRTLPSDVSKRSAANYLAKLVISSISDVFKSAKLVQNWLLAVAECVCRDFEQPMQWVTPLGLPVVQPYYNFIEEPAEYDPSLSTMREDAASLMVFQHHLACRPTIRKHLASLPANYIHSLDATHMMLSALHCARVGVQFASVHDCYWTLPCDVNTMNRICREQFCNLHSTDQLQLFADNLRPLAVDAIKSENPEKKRRGAYLIRLLRSRPEKGSLNIEDVKRTPYFFS